MSHALATVRHGGRRPPVNPKSEIRNSRDGWVASDPFPYPYPFPSPTGRVGRHSLPLSSRARRRNPWGLGRWAEAHPTIPRKVWVRRRVGLGPPSVLPLVSSG